MKLVIMAGGSGTRLWPVSRQAEPKQVKLFLDNQTLLQKTFLRLKRSFPLKNIYISSNIEHFKFIKNQLPKFPINQLILEPLRKDTAAAIGFAVINLLNKDPQTILATINSDQYIEKTDKFSKALKLAKKIIQKFPKKILLIGINPTYPETGYGYIKLGEKINNKITKNLFKVEQFVEKPDFKKAKFFLGQWNYLWNPAIFVFRADFMLDLIKDHLPQQYKSLLKIKKAAAQKKNHNFIKKEFGKIKPISIDYGIMEKTKDLLCLPADFGWADVGHWRTVKDILSKKDDDNITKGRYLGLESRGNLAYSYSNKLIATIGMKDTIIIETQDAILVCPKDKAQDVKKLVERLKEKGFSKYL